MEAKSASDLALAVLNFYEQLAHPQETHIQGNDFRLDQWVKQAVVVAARSVPGQGVMLASPTGARLMPRTPVKNIQWVAGQAYDLITMIQPRPGTWRLAGAQAAGSRVLLTTNLSLTVAGTPGKVAEDEALMVTAALDHKKGTLCRRGGAQRRGIPR